MQHRNRLLLAVLIDAENVSAAFAESILAKTSIIGEPAPRRAYGDWSKSSMKAWSEKSLALGLVPCQQTASVKGKNASDIALVIDAMDILHDGLFDGFVLVSSDSDFTCLANRLREAGRVVIGIGEKKTHISFRSTCHQFVFLEDIGPQKICVKPNEAVKESSITPLALIKQASENADRDREWVDLSILGKLILAIQPDFDVRS